MFLLYPHNQNLTIYGVRASPSLPNFGVRASHNKNSERRKKPDEMKFHQAFQKKNNKMRNNVRKESFKVTDGGLKNRPFDPLFSLTPISLSYHNQNIYQSLPRKPAKPHILRPKQPK